MIELIGKPVFEGIATGQARYVRTSAGDVGPRPIEDTAAETDRFLNARETAVKQLRVLREKAADEFGEAQAVLFETHELMLLDEDFSDYALSVITEEKQNAEYAVSRAAKKFAGVLTALEDAYMRERAADVYDVSKRLINCLTGADERIDLGDFPVILCAEDLSPGETAQLDKTKILALATSGGSTASHTAILARTLGIPAVIGVKGLNAEVDGKPVALDAAEGRLFIEPNAETVRILAEKKRREIRRRETLLRFKGKSVKTVDGRSVEVCANISDPSETNLALQYDADGVGLFRSEFLYLKNRDYPTENELFEAYRTTVSAFAEKRVVIRTLDIGADKRIDYFHLKKEENPALGLRGIRLCLERPGLFLTQLRAVYRASAFGKTAVMFPMIANMDEVNEALKMCAEVRTQLAKEGLAFDPGMEIGVMIETPAAALISDLLAEKVDFFSIGTNDLTQYTLCVDRVNSDVDRFADPHHPAVLRLIRTVAENAGKHKVRVCICGELAGDLNLTGEFLKMGVDELSVSPSLIPGLKEKIRLLDLRAN
ncbi:MAG: phosphoenolpyruvate--protein phosphotransferase [Fusobacteriaceae bacterium]|jgi:phosphotransferase system enzyme I (PtsI)|nr:phosphoenolpyruvate--protein phosphotransferase [Fusobacteriaceae bacterium]